MIFRAVSRLSVFLSPVFSAVRVKEMSQVTKTHYQAKYDFEATGKGQLSIKVGEKFVLVSKTGDEWWTVRSSDGNLGLVPASYLEPFEVILY